MCPDFDGAASMTAAFLLCPGAVLVFPGGQDRNFHNFFVKPVNYLFNAVRPNSAGSRPGAGLTFGLKAKGPFRRNSRKLPAAFP
jgi:hypothetical protein